MAPLDAAGFGPRGDIIGGPRWASTSPTRWPRLILGMMTNGPMACSIIRTAVTMRTATPSAGARSYRTPHQRGASKPGQRAR